MNLTPEMFVFFLLVFTAVGAVFLFIHLLMGSLLRPYIPETEKLTIYECGEPTVGSAWIQFDLRYYVVALLFVIFDVEVAFFFPWATVFGKANELGSMEDVRIVATSLDKLEKRKQQVLTPEETEYQKKLDDRRAKLSAQLMPTALSIPRKEKLGLHWFNPETNTYEAVPISANAAHSWAQIAFWDIAIFFGVLMVGFAYLWRRGDLNWVKSYEAHQEPAMPPEKPLEQVKSAPTPQPVSAH